MTKLAEFCRTGSGGTPSRSQKERYYEDGDIPWVKSGELRESLITSTDEHVTELALKETSVKLVPAGSILLAMYGATVGRLAILGIEATTNQAVCHIVPDPAIADTRYLYHAISAQVPAIIAMGVGGAQPNISQGLIKDLTVSLPRIQEQRRIASILDQADALRAKRREALAQLDSLTQSIFIEMFGDPVTNPKGLPKLPIGECAEISTGSTPSRAVENYFSGEIPWVKTTEVKGESIWNTEEKLTEEGFKAIRGKLHPIDSIIVAMYGQGQTRGRCGLLKVASSCNQACGVIHPSKAFDMHFMFHQLRLAYQQLRAMGRGGNQENLNLQLLGSFEILLPSLTRQQSFAEQIKSVERLKANEIFSLTELDALFASLQHRAFRGEL